MGNLFNIHFTLNLIIGLLLEFVLIVSIVLLNSFIFFDFSLTATLGYDPLFIKSLSLAITYSASCYYYDLYTPDLYRPDRQMILNVFKATIVSTLILFTAYFVSPSFGFERVIIIISLLMSPVVLIAWRAIFVEVLSVEIPEKKVLIIGYGALAKKIGAEILRLHGHGLKLTGYIDDHIDPSKSDLNSDRKIKNFVKNKASNSRRKEDLGVIGGFGDIFTIATSEKIYKIITAAAERRAKLPMAVLLQCKLQGVKIVEGENFYERITGKIPLEQIKPSWIVFSEGFRTLRSKKIIKRIFDIALSTIGIILASPLFLISFILIKLESKGPAIYKQIRVGENEKEYEIYKYRSMRVDAEEKTGPVWAKAGDSRVTKIGQFIRKARIDELPQLINVLKGDMSFVGPRPERPNFVVDLKKTIPFYEMRTLVKPGITGWAQIKFPYGATIEEAREKLQYDIFYIKNMSPLLDAIIVFSTIKVVLARKGSR